MIRNENEYRQAVQRLDKERARLDSQQSQLETMGLAADAVKRVLDPMRSFHLQMCEEVESYERLRRGEFPETRNLRGLGHLLISFRIARGVSQRALAKRLGVHESQISRDERNEYHGITLERAGRILDALGVELHSTVEMPRSNDVTMA